MRSCPQIGGTFAGRGQPWEWWYYQVTSYSNFYCCTICCIHSKNKFRDSYVELCNLLFAEHSGAVGVTTALGIANALLWLSTKRSFAG